jgi:hypothetical protein
MGLYLNMLYPNNCPKEGILDMGKIQKYLDTLARSYINIPKPKVSPYVICCPFNLVSD